MVYGRFTFREISSMPELNVILSELLKRKRFIVDSLFCWLLNRELFLIVQDWKVALNYTYKNE